MARITINIPDDKLQTIIDAFAVEFGWTELIEDGDDEIPNPESKAEHAKRQVRNFVVDTVRRAKQKNVEAEKEILQKAAETEATNDTNEITIS